MRLVRDTMEGARWWQLKRGDRLDAIVCFDRRQWVVNVRIRSRWFCVQSARAWVPLSVREHLTPSRQIGPVWLFIQRVR